MERKNSAYESNPAEERVAIVDENDNVIGETTVSESHLKGLQHRIVSTYLINSKKQVLLQQREDNKLWDHSSAGHMPTEEDYLSCAVREFEEELGVHVPAEEFKEISYGRHRPGSLHIAKNYVVRKDIPVGEFQPQKEEVVAVRYFNLEELRRLLSENPSKVTNGARFLLEKFIMKMME